MKLKHIKSELILLRLAYVIDEFICTRCTYLKGGLKGLTTVHTLYCIQITGNTLSWSNVM